MIKGGTSGAAGRGIAENFSTAFLQRLGVVALLVSLALTLSGCRIKGRLVKKEAPPAEFTSPLPASGRAGMSLEEIRQSLSERRARIKSAQAAMSLSIGSARSRARQQFDASVYSRPATGEESELLRVRGSADAGPVFDFLLSRNEVQTIVFPERRFYRGSLADLRSNPQVLAGVQPEDLAGAFLVERTLYQRLREHPQAGLEETNDHYVLTFTGASGEMERFHLRKADLLVDLAERGNPARPLSSVRYYGYRWDETGGLIPTRYDASLPNGAEVTVNVGQVRFNAAAPEGVARMTVPDGYERLSL